METERPTLNPVAAEIAKMKRAQQEAASQTEPEPVEIPMDTGPSSKKKGVLVLIGIVVVAAIVALIFKFKP